MQSVSMFSVKKIRADFPILQKKVNRQQLIFLDSTSTSQKPKQVLQAINEYYENYNANPHRSLYKLCEKATELYENAHEDAAKFIGAHGKAEIVFVRNTNEAINLVMYSWAMNNLKAGDEILLTLMEHHANIVPWQFLQKFGVKLKFVKLDDSGTLDMDDFEQQLTKEVKLVSLTHCSNVLGTINDVEKLSKLAHDNGSLFLVDAAQSVPHMTVDVKKIDCDFLAFSGHKMLGPMNIGVLYGKSEILGKMEPFMRGSDMIKEVKLTESSWNDLPWKFEAGTPNVEGAVGLSAAIDYLTKIGMEEIQKHEGRLTEYALEKLSTVDGITIYGPQNGIKRGGIISFNLKGIHSHDVAQILDDFGIAIRSGHHCAMPLMKYLGIQSAARASFYLYTTKDEIDALANGLQKVNQVFK